MSKGDWIQTYTGKRVYPLSLDIGDIDILDIAHSLSQICRFTGHTNLFYSVAEHSIRVAKLVSTMKYDSGLILAALLHDAHEVYIGDMSRPLKRSLTESDIEQLERDLQWKIFSRFNCNKALENYDIIKQADNILLMTEGRDLMHGGIKGWHDVENSEVLETPISPYIGPTFVETMFLKEFKKYNVTI